MQPQTARQAAAAYIFPSDPDRMDRATAQVEARRYALWVGSAEAASSGRHSTRSSEFDWALRRLSAVERGAGVSEQETMLSLVKTDAGKAIIGERLERAQKNQADWLRDLSLAKASQFMSGAAVAA